MEEKRKINPKRIGWGIFYLAAGVLLFVFFWLVKTPAFLNIIEKYSPEILWCFSWAAIGVGIGLLNSRSAHNDNQNNHWHYYTYFIFVWLAATLAAFVALGTFENNIVRSYAAAALTGLAVGFVGDNLPEKFFGIK